MISENKKLRTVFRWSIRLVVVLFVVFGLQVAVLAYPQIIVHNSYQNGTVAIYCDAPIDDNIRELAARVDYRLRGSGFYDSSGTYRVFLFRSPKLYSVFARLTLLRPIPQGFNLSIFRNTFVSASRSRELGKWTGGIPRYSIWDGDLSHLMAHEIAHQYVIDRIGRGRWKGLPHWKREGLPEYIANIGAICEDGPTLPTRIAILRDNTQWWAGSRADGSDGWDRIHYEAGLMVEYLVEVEGHTVEEVLPDSVSRSDVRRRMIAWAEARASRP